MYSRLLQGSKPYQRQKYRLPSDSDDVPLGEVAAGRARIVCCIRKDGLRLGHLDQIPTASVHLYIQYIEPVNYKFSSASFKLSVVATEEQDLPVVTNHVYPEIILGPPTTRQDHTEVHAVPQIEAMNVSVSGIG